MAPGVSKEIDEKTTAHDSIRTKDLKKAGGVCILKNGELKGPVEIREALGGGLSDVNVRLDARVG